MVDNFLLAIAGEVQCRLNLSSGILPIWQSDLIGDFEGTKKCLKGAVASGNECASCPRSIYSLRTYLVMHIWRVLRCNLFNVNDCSKGASGSVHELPLNLR